MNAQRTCECGCGMAVSRGRSFRHGHWAKANRTRIGATKRTGIPCDHGDGYLTIDHKLEHVIVAERALGHTLPPNAVVHHVNGNKSDNRGCNMVICNDQSYHALIHQRTRAFDACGHPGWRKCAFCGQYDDPVNLYIPPRRGTVEHRACGRAYRAERLRTQSC